MAAGKAEEARANVQLAELALSQMNLYAPISGLISRPMVKEGTYKENVDLNGRSGTEDKPVWIVSADGKGAAIVVSANPDKPVFAGYGESNLIIKGFEIVGGTEGVKVTQSLFDYAIL